MNPFSKDAVLFIVKVVWKSSLSQSTYLTKHNLINKRQYSFRELHSTELTITTIYDETFLIN